MDGSMDGGMDGEKEGGREEGGREGEQWEEGREGLTIFAKYSIVQVLINQEIKSNILCLKIFFCKRGIRRA